MIRSQRGFTLIELLVTLAIASFISVIIWNIFIQGKNFSQKSISKNFIQQEANIVNTNLIRIHQKSKQYVISNNNCEINVLITNSNGTNETQLFSDTKLCYSINFSGTVVPNQEDKNISLTVSDRKDPDNIVMITTLLYRLKGGGI